MMFDFTRAWREVPAPVKLSYWLAWRLMRLEGAHPKPRLSHNTQNEFEASL